VLRPVSAEESNAIFAWLGPSPPGDGRVLPV